MIKVKRKTTTENRVVIEDELKIYIHEDVDPELEGIEEGRLKNILTIDYSDRKKLGEFLLSINKEEL